MITVENLSVGYRESQHKVLGELNLQVAPGTFVCLLGRNGAGKSTLLRTLAGLQPATGGRALLGARDIHALAPMERARQIGVVLTERDFGLGLSVEDVVSMGRQPHTDWRGSLSSEDRARVVRAIHDVGAAALSGRYVSDLSDGERQRIMIARAIAQAPRLMLLDEITAFLDLPGRVATMLLLKEYAAKNGAVVILSSHDLELSLQLADTTWLLDGSGCCVAGSPETVQSSGAIGRVFDTDKVAYSSEHGRFELINAKQTFALPENETAG